MPFVEIKKNQLVDECSFTTSANLRVPKALLEQRTIKRHLRLFVDEENKLIGLQPNDDGYTLTLSPRQSRTVLTCKLVPLLKFLSQGRHKIAWNEKQQMFIIKYAE